MAIQLFRVVDVETCGYEDDGPGDLVELGWTDVTFVNGALSKLDIPQSRLFKPVRPICNMGRSIHQISNHGISHAPARDLNEFLHKLPKADAYVAHNKEFEIKILPEIADATWICTYRAAVSLLPDARSHSNQYLRFEMNSLETLKIPERAGLPVHRAGPDSLVTAANLAMLVKYASLERMVEISNTTQPVKYIRFGEHKGKTFTDQTVPSSYLTWIASKDTFDPSITLSAKNELERRRSVTGPGMANLFSGPGV